MIVAEFRTWVRALFGERRAILELASSPSTFAAGVLFALSAGLAREYDGVWLVREGWHALLPLLVSSITGTIFWAAFFRPWRGGGPSWRAFLGLFWMSAPLAWLYGIPYERFLTPLGAFHANLWTLVLVSFWRVLWMTRVLGVLRGTHVVRTLIGVLFVADLVVMAAAWFAPRSIVAVMGGVRGSALEAVVGGANNAALWLSMLALPALGVAALVARSFRYSPTALEPSRGSPHSLARVALLASGIWLFLSLWAQPEQARRWEVERDLRAGRIRAALAAMSAHVPDDYPPGWDPPPHALLYDDEPAIEDVFEVLLREPVSPWVGERFVPKFFHGWTHDAGHELGNWAAAHGEEDAQRVLELLAGHAQVLEPDDRATVLQLRDHVAQGRRLAFDEDGLQPTQGATEE